MHTRSRPWLLRIAAGALALSAVAVSGCGTVSFKAGATENDYQAAGDRCRKEGHAESPDFERCMGEQGWSVKQLSEPTSPSDTSGSLVTETPPPESPPAPTGTNAAPAPTGTDIAPEPAGAVVTPKPTGTNTASTPALGHAPSVTRPMVVKNWFKLGGTADGLAAAKARCATKLGTTPPESASQPVSGEMLDCLRNEGWRAF